MIYMITTMVLTHLLQHNREQPNMEYATAIGSEADMDVLQRKYNTSIYDFVQKLPGITSKNIDTFLRKVKNLDKALSMTEVHRIFYLVITP